MSVAAGPRSSLMNVDRLTAHRLLTAAEERRLFELLRDTDPRVSRSARERLVRKNLRLVAKEARGFYVPDEAAHDHDDLFQAGVEGLMRAIEKFDPAKGCRLSTYATRWIHQSIGRFVANHVSTIRLPVGVREDLENARRARFDLSEPGETDSSETEVAEVARRAGVTQRRLWAVEIYAAASIPTSLEAPAGRPGQEDTGTGSSLGDLLPDSERGTDEEALMALGTAAAEGALSEALRALPDDLREVLRLRFGLGDAEGGGTTLKGAGSELGISHEAVRKREKAALRILRDHLTSAPGDLGEAA